MACGGNSGEDHCGKFEVNQAHIVCLRHPFFFFFFVFQQKNASVIGNGGTGTRTFLFVFGSHIFFEGP